jgi:hypothetical protein
MKKLLFALAMFVPFTVHAQRGIARGHALIVRAPMIRPQIIIAPQYGVLCYDWYYDCYDPYVMRPVPHRTVVVVVGQPKEVVDTIFVKDSTMKDTIKVIKRK